VFASYRIGSLFGIPVRIHGALLVLLAVFVVLSGFDPAVLLGLLTLLLVLGLHELGHALMAKRLGIRVHDITFWPLGGMARMGEMPERWWVEFLIALAGPAVNFALAAPAALAILVMGWPFDLLPPPLPFPDPAGFASFFLALNLALGLLNLLPAFPMDGGRVLRSLLARKQSWIAATTTAVRVGRWLAFGMILAGLPQPGLLLYLVPVAVYVWFSGARELWIVHLRRAATAMGNGGPGGPGGAAAGPFGFSFRTFHARPGPGQEPPREVELDEIAGAPEDEAPRPEGGFDERTISELEKHRGRLPRLRKRD